MKFVATNVYEINAQTGEVFHYVSLTYEDREADELIRELQLQQQQQQSNINNNGREENGTSDKDGLNEQQNANEENKV